MHMHIYMYVMNTIHCGILHIIVVFATPAHHAT